jgi:hypothetical protein
LNGIGGNTILDAKKKLTFTEAVTWNSYIKKRGSLNVGRRVEISGSVNAALLSRVHGGKATFEDFAIHEKEKSDQISEFSKAFGASVMTREQYKNRKKR